jgi:hypothetical protein
MRIRMRLRVRMRMRVIVITVVMVIARLVHVTGRVPALMGAAG